MVKILEKAQGAPNVFTVWTNTFTEMGALQADVGR